jgi:hypothetical protein
MEGMMGILSYGIGTVLGFLLVGWLVFAIVQDVTQKKHTVLRNFPVIGRLRFFFRGSRRIFSPVFLCRRSR